MRQRALFLAGLMMGLLVCTLVYADIPRAINFQGRLTDSGGKFVPDGNYSLTFRMYSDSTGGSAKWSEGQLVSVSKGLFNVILGSATPIPDSIFNYPNTWLGIQVGADPEMTPRQRLSSLGYAYRGAKADTSSYSKDSDKLDGLHASDFSSVGTDYGRSGVATDLYEGTTKLIDKYLQQGQANSVNSSMIVDSTITNADISGTANISPSKIFGTAWTSTNDGPGSGLDADLLDGQQGSYYTNAGNISSGNLADARLSANVDLLNAAQIFTGVKTFNPSSGSVPFAVDASKNGAVTNLNADLLDGQHGSAFISTGADYGRSGVATDLYEGTSTLTNKYVNTQGPDTVSSSTGMAFTGYASGSSSQLMIGIRGGVINNSSGSASGGNFWAGEWGTGTHYGVYAQAGGLSSSPAYGVYGLCISSSAGSAYGVYGEGYNNSSGTVYGGFFSTSNSGTGEHYGLRAEGYGNSSAITYGAYSLANNTSTGNVYGGYFKADSAGTGTHYGARAEGYGKTSAFTCGSYGYAHNSSNGSVFGGYFETSASGTGEHYAVRASSAGNSSNRSVGVWGEANNAGYADAYGVFGWADHYGTGDAYGVFGYVSSAVNATAYGGYFTTPFFGSGKRYGVLAASFGVSDSSTYGVYGSAINTSTGDVYAGYFSASYGIGTGTYHGVYAVGDNASSSPAYGTYSYAKNSSSGYVYAGYFAADSAGSGAQFGVYAQASIAYWAGWFQGDLGVSRNLYVYGSKSSAVKVNDGEYRAFYSQESPENWFEDFGEGRLVNGKAHIDLEPLFLQTVTINSLNSMKVFVQLEGDCNGVFVTKGTTGFDVTELKGGASSVAFSYRVVAKRKGYENLRLAMVKGPTPEQMTLEQATNQTEFARERVQREEEQKKMEAKREKMNQERL